VYPLVNEPMYRLAQTAVKAWDIRTGRWYEPEIDLVRPGVRPGEVVLDIGANFGMWAYHLSRAVGSWGRVYAFEPVPFTVSTLRFIARVLGLRNVEIVPKGCGDRAGRLTFRIPLQRSGALSAGLAHLALRNDDRAGKETQVRWEQTREIECEVVALDDFLPTLTALSFVKCDIEGGELFALRGARRLLDTHRPTVLLEINPWYLEGVGVRVEELTGFFFERGYALCQYDVEDGHGTLRPCAVGDIIERNYCFIHPSRRERFRPLMAREPTH
jgi:FkbM family methyltransferase